jgi:hypothetical protein
MAMLALYTIDFVSVQYRLPAHREQTGSVPISVYYAIVHKGNKVEYTVGDPETETCAMSLFPQLGYRPCWYVNRHRVKWIRIG